MREKILRYNNELTEIIVNKQNLLQMIDTFMQKAFVKAYPQIFKISKTQFLISITSHTCKILYQSLNHLSLCIFAHNFLHNSLFTSRLTKNSLHFINTSISPDLSECRNYYYKHISLISLLYTYMYVKNTFNIYCSRYAMPL